MCWTWSEWLECPVLLMLGNTRSPAGELTGPSMGGRAALCLDGFLSRAPFLPSLIMVLVS